MHRTGLLVFLAVLLLSLPQAALLPLLDRDEPRFAEASREMLQSGNFIVPTFNHAPRYAKPPLIYWTQALSYMLFGENALAARLPSLLATAGTAWLLFAWGIQLGNRQTGLIAAFSYAFCLQTMQQGRVATADALLIFCMTLTVFAGWKRIAASNANLPSQNYFYDVLLVIGLAGGFLAKGPEAFLPLIALLFCARKAARPAMPLACDFVISIGVILLWALPAYAMTHGDYWRVGLSEGVGERMVTGLQGHGATSFGWYVASLPLYLILFWISALPWSPLLVLYRKKLFTAWRPDPLDACLLLNAGIIFLVFSLMVTKLPHYTLPAFPFLALLFARRWNAAGLPSALPVRLAVGFGIIFALLAAVLIPVAIVHGASPSPVGELVRDARGVLTPQTEFALVDFQESNAIWEMRRVVTRYGHVISEFEALSFLNQPGPHAVVLSTATWQRLRAQADPAWKIYEARGWNSAKAWDSAKRTIARVDLTLVVKP